MKLQEVIANAKGFTTWTFVNKIKLLCWHLQANEEKPFITPPDLRRCFEELSISPPANVANVLSSLAKSKQVLKSKNGYKLEKTTFDNLTKSYGSRISTVALTADLEALLLKTHGEAEREYLREALTCFKVKAYRATIVMGWNLAYDHFLRWILKDQSRHASFNQQLLIQYPKSAAVRTFDDFTNMKESEILAVSRKILNNSKHKVLDEKLKRRNAVAHPGGLRVNDLTAEEFLRDLVDNVLDL